MRISSRSSLSVLACVVLIAVACSEAGDGASPPPAALETEEQKTLYAVGLVLGGNLAPLDLTPPELELVQRGIRDAASGSPPAVDPKAYAQRVNELARSRSQAGLEKRRKASEAGAAAEKERGEAYAAEAARAPGAERLESGLVFRSLKAGEGNRPAATDTVRVHYQGRLIDGTEFDSSVKRGEAAEFPLDGVIPCWTEGVQRMKVGGKALLVCPSSIAYGDSGRPPQIPGGATLVFEVELLGIGGS